MPEGKIQNIDASTFPQERKAEIAGYARQEQNYTLVRDFMARFNNMKPDIASQLYVKDSLRRTRWEDGEV